MNDFTASDQSTASDESTRDHEAARDDSTASSRASAGAVPGRPPLRRAYHGRMLGGVAAGIGGYLGVDPNIVRIAFAVLTLAGGAGVPAYIACLLLIPEEGTDVCLAASLIGSVQPRLRPPRWSAHARRDRSSHATITEGTSDVFLVRSALDTPDPFWRG